MRINRDTVLGMLLGAGLLGGGLALGGAGRPLEQRSRQDQDPPVLRARSLQIVDELGTEVLVLGSNTRGGSLSVRDRFGRPMLVAGTDAAGGTMALMARGSSEPVLVERADDTGGRLEIFDAAGRRAVQTSATAAGGVVRVHGNEGRPAAEMTCTEGGRGKIHTLAPGGEALVLLTATADDQGQIYTRHASGRPLAAIATSPHGPVFQLLNRFGEVVVSLESDESGEGRVKILSRGDAATVIGPQETGEP